MRYYYLSEPTPYAHSDLAEKLGYQSSMWFSNHGPGGTRPEFTWNDMITKEIHAEVLYHTCDSRIFAAGHRGNPRNWQGILVPNGEWLTEMFHPNDQAEYEPLEALRHYQLLADLLHSRYPGALIGTWNVPTAIDYWGDNLDKRHDLDGIQMVGRVSAMYDLMVPSGYFGGFPTVEKDKFHITRKLEWADTFGRPILVGTNPWKRMRSDGLWYPVPEEDMYWLKELIDQLANLYGLEVWSMCRKRDIRLGRMAPDVTEDDIDRQHELALRIFA
jgi:hypothetical protein